MKRVLLILGWFLASSCLYGSMVALEFYWNLLDWQPRTDLNAWLILFSMLALLAGIWFLARAGRDRVTRIVSLFFCLALAGLGTYVLAPEPTNQGLLGRVSPSPFWYRGSRLALLLLPGAFWLVGLVRAVGRQPSAPPCRPESVVGPGRQ